MSKQRTEKNEADNTQEDYNNLFEETESTPVKMGKSSLPRKFISQLGEKLQGTNKNIRISWDELQKLTGSNAKKCYPSQWSRKFNASPDFVDRNIEVRCAFDSETQYLFLIKK